MAPGSGTDRLVGGSSRTVAWPSAGEDCDDDCGHLRRLAGEFHVQRPPDRRRRGRVLVGAAFATSDAQQLVDWSRPRANASPRCSSPTPTRPLPRATGHHRRLPGVQRSRPRRWRGRCARWRPSLLRPTRRLEAAIAKLPWPTDRSQRLWHGSSVGPTLGPPDAGGSPRSRRTPAPRVRERRHAVGKVHLGPCLDEQGARPRCAPGHRRRGSPRGAPSSRGG